MSDADLTTLTQGVKDQLKFLNTTYLQSISESVFGDGNNMDILNNYANGNGSGNAILNVIPNDVNATVSIFDTVTNSYGTPILINTVLDSINPNISEINCLSLLDSSPGSISDKKYISGLYTLYAILNPAYYDNFILSIKNNQPFASPLNIPVLSTSTSTSVNKNQINMIDVSQQISTYLGYIDSNLLTKIYNIPDFNAFIARRIVYLWILMYNFRIAFNYYLTSSDSVSQNLALACLQILQNNNGNYNYNSPLNNSIQSSESSQRFLLYYQMWQTVLQLLIPSSKADFTNLDTGSFDIKNDSKGKAFVCTGISKDIIIKQLPSIFMNLYINFPSIKANAIDEYVNEITNILTNIEKSGACNEDLSTTLATDALATKNTAEQNNNAAKIANDNALAALKSAQSAAGVAKTAASTASSAATTAYTNLQNAKNLITADSSQLASANSKKTDDLKNIPVVPTYQSLIPVNTVIDIGKNKLPFTKPSSQNFNLTGSAISYTFSFDIKTSAYGNPWFNILQNGADGVPTSQSVNGMIRYPSAWISSKGSIHYIHDTKTPTNNSVVGNIILPLNTWNTVTIVVSNNTIYLYINGILDVQTSANPSNPLAWGPNNTITNTWNWHTSTPNLNDVTVKNANWWTSALNASTILQYYNKLNNITPSIIAQDDSLIQSYTTKFNTDSNALTTQGYQAKYDSAATALTLANNALAASNQDVINKNNAYVTTYKTYAMTSSLLKASETLVTELSSITSVTNISLVTLKGITSQIYNLTQSYNTQSTIPSIDLNIDTLHPLKESINNNITKYRNNQTEINNLVPILNKNKETLKNTQIQLKSRKDQGSKLNMYKYIELSIMILITIFAFIIISIPFEKSMKSVLTMILSLIAIANILIIYYVFDSPGLVETFDDNIVQPLLSQSNNNINTALHQFMDASIEYLIQTDNLNILLQSQMVYGNVNQGLSKELTYYNNTSTQLINSNININSVYKSSYMTQINYSAAMQLFMSLSLIVAGFTISFVTLESLEIVGSVYSWVSGITAFFIVIVLIIYMLEVNNRVHTNPKQIYWGNPKKLQN